MASAASMPGSRRASTTWGRVGASIRASRARAVASSTAASMAARSRGSRSRPRQAMASDEVSAPRLRRTASTRSRAVSTTGSGPDHGFGTGFGVQRIQADGTARAQRHRGDTPRLGQGPVLPFRIDHPGMAPEDGLAPQVGLDEGALPPTDLAEHHHVGIGHHPLSVERERVVDEGTAEHVPTDEDALVPETGLAHQRIGGTEVPGGGHMGGDPGSGPPSRQTPAQREGAGERHVLLPEEEAELDPGLAGRLLDGGTGGPQLVPALAGDGHVSGEPVLGVAVGQLDVPLLDALLLAGRGGR